jgi:hypothetical protein
MSFRGENIKRRREEGEKCNRKMKNRERKRKKGERKRENGKGK